MAPDETMNLRRYRFLSATPHTFSEVAALADEAHDVLLTDGWCQGFLHGEDGTHCALGAINVARDRLRLTGAAPVLEYAMCQRIRRRAPRDTAYSITAWNDEVERTLDDVLDMFRHTAKTLREIPDDH